jgi:hypothetical protein
MHATYNFRFFKFELQVELHNRLVHVVEEFMAEARAVKGLDLRLDIRQIRSGASRDRFGMLFI